MAVLEAAGPRPDALPHARSGCGVYQCARGHRLAAPPRACLEPRPPSTRCDLSASAVEPSASLGVQCTRCPRASLGW
jgi:hypothetical protein